MISWCVVGKEGGKGGGKEGRRNGSKGGREGGRNERITGKEGRREGGRKEGRKEEKKEFKCMCMNVYECNCTIFFFSSIFAIFFLFLFWAAAPKGRCPVGHRGELLHPSNNTYVPPGSLKSGHPYLK